MRRVLPILAFTVLLLPVVAMGQSDPALWRFVDPNAKALIGIDWARIRTLHAGTMIREQWLTAGALAAVPGLELLDQVDRVLISSPGKNSADDSSESAILIAIHGHFDAAKVRQLFTHLGAKPQSYNSFQVYRPQGKHPEGSDLKDTAWVLFDAETILFGDAPSIFAALDRNQFVQASTQPTPASGSMLARAAEMDARYELWVILAATEMMSSDRIAALFHGGDWASEVQGLEAGFDLRTGLAADVTVRFSSDAIAKRVTAELTHVVNLAVKDKSAGAQAQNIAKKLKFNVDGSAAKVSLRLTEQELEESTVAFAASRKAAAANAGLTEGVKEKLTSNAPPAPVPVATPAKPGVIRIEGLDEGTREIPYHEPPH
jgi:hypothetical protein